MANNNVATIMTEKDAEKPSSGCQICHVPLVEEHGGDTNLRYGLCLEHLTKVLGQGTRQEAMALLLARGVIMACYYSADQRYKLRVEVRSSWRNELTLLENQLGVGRIYRHRGNMLRWSCASIADIHKMGGVLMPVIPEFGTLLQLYAVQPDPTTRSAFAEAFMRKMGRRTVHLLSHL